MRTVLIVLVALATGSLALRPSVFYQDLSGAAPTYDIRQASADSAAANAIAEFGWDNDFSPSASTFNAQRRVWESKVSCVRRVLGPERAAATLYTPGSLEYNKTLYLDNARLVLFPRCVVSPRDESDVAAAMEASRNCSLHFSVLSGGHSAAGYCLAQGGLTLNMRSMNSSTFFQVPNLEGTNNENRNGKENQNQTLVTVGAGSRFAELYEALYQRGKGEIVVGGGCPQVAFGGFMQGGGWSFVSRSYGLGIDNMVSAKIVLPNLTVATLSANHPDQDLWWAIRGGGGGNWGVVTEYTVKVHHPTGLAVNGEICWNQYSDRIRPMMEVWIDLFPTMPNWLAMLPVWIPMGHNGTRHFCYTVICNNVASECDPWLAPMRANSPDINTLRVEPFLSWSMANVNVTSAPTHALEYIRSYFFTPANFSIEIIDVLIDAIKGAPSQKNLVLFHLGGGAISNVAKNATAFPHRDAMMLMQIKSLWDHPSEEAAQMRWINNISSHVAHKTTGSYVNYVDAELEDWQTAYYAGNYPRLEKIKKRVDPDNFFHFNQSVGSPYKPQRRE